MGQDHFHDVVWVITKDGDDYLKHLSDLGELGARDPGAPADLIGQLSDFPRLETLTLVGSDANEKGLKYAGQQGSLRTLHLFRPFQFTEQGMAHLAGLGELQSLTITSTQIESLRGLERVPSLRHLFIDHSDFKGECFQHLQALTQLRQLRLASREVTLTDEDLIHLGSLTQLEHLAVDVSEITEEGVRHLAGLENLQSLSLAETTISADGLRHLATLNNLRSLTVKFSGKQEAAWLQQQLPGCTVRFRR